MTPPLKAYLFFQTADMSSRVFPLVSGTNFHTNIAESRAMTAYMVYVPPTLHALREGNVEDTRKFATHCMATAIATACDLIVFGKISEISTQQIGPHDIMKEAV